MKNFQNKVAVVTGAASGIGQALVVELAKRGAHIAFCDIASLEETQSKIAQYNVRQYTESVDMGSKPAIREFVANVIDFYGAVDLLINNAGIALGDRCFGEVTAEDFEKITNVNYWGVIESTQSFYPHMLRQSEAAVVNISSAQGILALPQLVPYCTTKFAVRGFTDTLRMEHKIRGIKNITFHTVHPGRVATDITLHSDYQNGGNEKFHQHLQNGASPASAANTILNGVIKNKGRIFISDGRLHDLLARFIPDYSHHVIRLMMKLKGFKIV